MNNHDSHLAPRNWIKDDKRQLEWVRQYLEKSETLEETKSREFYTPQTYKTYESIINELEIKFATPEGIIYITKMKSAWSQSKYRSKLKSRDKKAYNFVLNTNIKQQLKVLAKQIDKPMNETLEDLISNTYFKVIKAKPGQKDNKKIAVDSNNSIRLMPYYFDGTNFYWSDGSMRGPIGAEIFNEDTRPYYFNGEQFFWYNGFPRTPTTDEIYRLNAQSISFTSDNSQDKQGWQKNSSGNYFSPLGAGKPYLPPEHPTEIDESPRRKGAISTEEYMNMLDEKQNSRIPKPRAMHFPLPMHTYTVYTSRILPDALENLKTLNSQEKTKPNYSTCQKRWQRRMRRQNWMQRNRPM